MQKELTVDSESLSPFKRIFISVNSNLTFWDMCLLDFLQKVKHAVASLFLYEHGSFPQEVIEYP